MLVHILPVRKVMFRVVNLYHYTHSARPLHCCDNRWSFAVTIQMQPETRRCIPLTAHTTLEIDRY